MAKLLLVLFLFDVWLLCIAGKHSWYERNDNFHIFANSVISREKDYRKNSNHEAIIKIHINTGHKMCELDPRFLSFTIDALEMKRKFRCFRMTSKKLNRLVKLLSPAYLRIGGTPQDFVSFTHNYEEGVSLDTNSQTCKPQFENWKTMKPFRLSMSYFSDVVQFTRRTGLDLIFGLNELNQRTTDHAWDESESIKLFNYAKNYGIPITWELGNEPNRYVKYGKNYTITAYQLAEDYRKLRRILKDETIVGPSIASRNPKALKYMKKFLMGRPQINALTYHHYFMHESISSVDKYVDPIFLEQLEEKMYAVKLVMNLTNTTTDLWLGEAGSSSGGGALNLSNTYAAGFLYLGRLGLASKHCHKIVIRQSLYGGYYGMIDPITHKPLPDYWTSVLFKKLVGTISLKTHKTVQNVRIYAFCSRENKDDITILAINFDRNSAKFTLNNYIEKDVEQYILTPGDNNLQSKTVLLNGNVLTFKKDHSLSDIKGERTQQPFQLPKTSYGFFVLKNVQAKSCRN